MAEKENKQERCSICGPCHNRKHILEVALQRILILLDREESLATLTSLEELKNQVISAQHVAADLLSHARDPVPTPVQEIRVAPADYEGGRATHRHHRQAGTVPGVIRPELWVMYHGGRAVNRLPQEPSRDPDFSVAQRERRTSSSLAVEPPSFSDAEEESPLESIE